MTAAERIVGDSVIDIVVRDQLWPDPLHHPEHYEPLLRSTVDRYIVWFNNRRASDPAWKQELSLPLKVRIHPAIIGGLGPRRVVRALGPLARVIEAPPQEASLNERTFCWVDDADQDVDVYEALERP